MESSIESSSSKSVLKKSISLLAVVVLFYSELVSRLSAKGPSLLFVELFLLKILTELNNLFIVFFTPLYIVYESILFKTSYIDFYDFIIDSLTDEKF